MKISVEKYRYRLKRPFTISRGSRTHADVLVARIEDDGRVGLGECVPYARYQEDLNSVAGDILNAPRPLDREILQTVLPRGAARNALDCALWDLEAKKSGIPVWKLAGIAQPNSVTTAYTVSLDEPERMREEASANRNRPLLKVKLGRGDDSERMRAVRDGAPDSGIIVDANEGWSPRQFENLVGLLEDLGVLMVEQPFPAASDDALDHIECSVGICADESCHDRSSLVNLKGRYSMINIKLDKTGGLTEALALKRQAEREGFEIMVGCMMGSSLAMAPAILVAQGASIVDLDGPLLLAEDCAHPLIYDCSSLAPPDSRLWG